MKGFRRKRQGKTDYRLRLRLIGSGKTRLVVRRTNKNIIVQFVDYSKKGDLVRNSSHTKELKKYGWSGATRNVYCGYLVGLLAGRKALKNEIKSAILDIGLEKSVKGGILYAVLKGVLDSGINIPHSEDVLPNEKRLKGEHAAEYSKKLGDRKNKVFSKYIKNKFDPEDIPKKIDEIKRRILEK